jgi:hypothetical protein
LRRQLDAPADDVKEILGRVAEDFFGSGSDCGDLLRSGIRNDPPDKIPVRLNFFPILLCFLASLPATASSFESMSASACERGQRSDVAVRHVSSRGH